MNNRFKLKIIGKNTKRFIKDLIKLKISIYYMENYEKYSIIIVDEKGFNKIKKKKTSYEIILIKEYGFIRIKNLCKKYSLFLIALFLGFILIKILSNIIFSIEVEHSKKEIRELILNDLEEYGIKKYNFRVNYQKKEEIKKKILSKETDRIEWLEIDRIGTKYIIKVEERIKNNINKKKEAQHIIAKKDAMILSIYAVSGEVKKKQYDYVKKGEILISGFITRDEKIVTKTKAEGDVYGEVWYNVKVDLPKKYKTVNKTGKIKKKVEINIFNKSIFLFDFKKFKTYKIDRNQIFKNKILPIKINLSTLYETNEITEIYNNKNVTKKSIKIASNKLKEKISKNSSIISKKVLKKTEKESRIVVDVFFKVKEDIKDTENIEKIKIEDIEGDKD